MTNNAIFSLRFFALILLLLIAAQCKPTRLATPPSANPPPSATVRLIPPIQAGDGSDLMDRLLQRGVLRVGIRVWPAAEFSPPAFRGFSNAVTGGALNGFEVDVARLVAEGLGLELELVEAYPPVIISGDWQGEWDIALASLVPFDQPVDKLIFSQPYAFMPAGILVRAHENDIQTFEQLAGRKVGVLEHSSYQRLLISEPDSLTVQGQPLLLGLPADVQPVALSNLPKAIRQLGDPANTDSIEFEAIFAPAPILQEAVKSGLPVKLIPQAQYLGFQPLAVAVVPQDDLKVERLILEINKILARLKRQGVLAEIYLRWYGQDFSQPE